MLMDHTARQRFGVAVLAALTLGASAAEADGIGRVEVTSVRPLLIAAIENGEAHGTLAGENVDTVRRLFRTQEPMFVDVKAIRELGELGCKRLQVTTTLKGAYPDERGLKVMTEQERIRTKNGTLPQDVQFAYQISFCRNGKFPKSAQAKEDD